MHKIRGEDNGPIVPHRSCQETPIVQKIGRIYQADWLLYRSPFQPLTDCCCCLVTSPLSSWESEIQGKRERTRTYLLVILLREKRHAHKLLTVWLTLVPRNKYKRARQHEPPTDAVCMEEQREKVLLATLKRKKKSCFALALRNERERERENER